jgi:aarF domain-containing kinase
MATVTAPPSLPFVRATTTPSSKKKKKKNHSNFGHFGQVVRKDMEFLKRGFNNGVEWANDAFRIPQIAKKVDDFVWLRNLENPQATSFSTPSWPEPWYPGIIPRKKIEFFDCGVCLYMVNLNCCESLFDEMGIGYFCGGTC